MSLGCSTMVGEKQGTGMNRWKGKEIPQNWGRE